MGVISALIPAFVSCGSGEETEEPAGGAQLSDAGFAATDGGEARAGDVPVPDAGGEDTAPGDAGSVETPDGVAVDVPSPPCPDGQGCDDGDPCTEGDTCDAAGVCEGQPVVCDDGDGCTADTCGPGGCVHAPVSGPCDDGDPCTVGDACAGGKCAGGGPKGCEDNDACTQDGCDPAAGCTHEAVDCSDGEPCTADTCDAAAGCVHTAKKAGESCLEQDKCLTGYTCTAAGGGAKLQCLGGKKVDCDDNNPCTDDGCLSATGCTHLMTTKACDDGQSCTSPDTCVGGLCMGQKTASCPKCTQGYKQPTAQITDFKIGATGKAGDGLDVDEDPKTCAPKGSCAGGIDNAFASVAALVNIPLGQALKAGQLTFVAEFKGYKGEGVPFTLNMYYAQLTPKSAAAKCPFLTKTCNWYVQQSALGADCKPKVSFVDAKVVGGKLTAGGSETLFVMDVVGSGGTAMLYAKGAHLEGEVSFAPDGVTIVSAKGVIGGAMDKKAFIQVIEGMPDSVFPVPKAGIIGTMNKMLKPDIDFDGDGVPEAASIGLRFTAIHGWIDGTQP